MTLTDAELADRVACGDLHAFDELYRRHIGAARTCARGLTRCPADRDDLVADAFLGVFLALRKGYRAEHFRAYLCTAIRNKNHDRTTRERRCPVSPQETLDAPSSDTDPAELLDRAPDPVLVGTTRLAFLALPPRWRAALWLTVVEERTPADLAGLFGITPGALSAMAYRARRRLRETHAVLCAAHGDG